MPMSGTTAQETAAGRAQQEAADRAASGLGARCGHVETRGRTTYVCIAAPHESGSPYTDDWRRRHGASVHADRHLFVGQDKACWQTVTGWTEREGEHLRKITVEGKSRDGRTRLGFAVVVDERNPYDYPRKMRALVRALTRAGLA